MKRLFRLPMISLCALSAALGLATGVLWVRGYWAQDSCDVAYTWVVPTRGDPGMAWHQRSFGWWATGGRFQLGWTKVSGGEPDIVLSAETGEHVEVYHPPGWSFKAHHSPWSSYRPGSAAWPAWQDALGLGWGKTTWATDHSDGNRWWLVLPDWLLFLLLMLPGLSFWFGTKWLRARHQQRCRRRRLCHVCGYDLRASPIRCPECGTIRAPTEDAVKKAS